MAKRKTAARKEGPKLSRRDRIQELKARINKNYGGKGVMMSGDEYEAPFLVLRRPSGIVELDIACGGGLPAGGLSELIGKTSSGKTTLMNQYFRRQQQLRGDDATLAIAMTEHKFDKGHAKFNCGVVLPIHKREIAAFEKTHRRILDDAERLKMSETLGVFEEIGSDIVDTLYEIILDCVEDKTFDIIGIDSWGAVLTKVAQEAEMDARIPGGAALINTMFVNKIAGLFAVPRGGEMNYTSVLGVNQYREKIGGKNMRAGDMTNMSVQGGNALKHLKLLSIYLDSSAYWKEVQGKNKRIGKKVKWTIYKGKAGCHDGASGEFNLIYGKGLDIAGANMMSALKRGIIRQRGAWLTIVDSSDETEILKANGKVKMTEALENDPEVHEWLVDEVVRYAIKEEGAIVNTNYLPPEDD